MKRGLLSVGAALTLVVAALPTSADAQSPQGGPGGRGGGGGAAVSAPSGGGGGGVARSLPSVRSGSPQGGGGQAFVPRGGSPQGGGQAFVPRSGSPQGQAHVQHGGGNWQGGGNWHNRSHIRRGPTFGFVAPYPYYSDYASPYYYEEDDGCYKVLPVQTVYGVQYRRVWVCE
jgi:hypothetical protein